MTDCKKKTHLSGLEAIVGRAEDWWLRGRTKSSRLGGRLEANRQQRLEAGTLNRRLADKKAGPKAGA